MAREAKTFCRICPAFCGLVLTIDEEDRILRIRGDHDHPRSEGFACIKGLTSAVLYHGAHRILHPLKRQANGSFAQVPAEQALDEIAERLAAIAERDGPDAVGFFKGSNVFYNTLPSALLHSFVNAFGSQSLFTNTTIDQSAKMVSADRLGSWNAGKNHMANADVTMLVGGNPMVAMAMFGLDAMNVVKKLKAYKARGGKLIVIDPRRTETAEFADIFLQPRPGEDAVIAAGMIRLVLANNWHDQEFCTRYAKQVEELRSAVEPFTPRYVADRADVSEALLIEATKYFAESSHGFVSTGTGPSMAPRSNLTQHLFDALEVLCGQFLREGEPVPNPGLVARREWRAEVIPPARCWENGPKSRVRGLGMLFGEKMAGVLAQEITTPGPGQVKALIVDGGNPATAIADQRRIVDAFKSLELLVTIDPEMTPTARLAHYVLPPKLQFEHPNLIGILEYETALHARPAQQYAEAAIRTPPGSDLVDDWSVYYSLAQRLGLQLKVNDVPLDMEHRPEPDDIFRLIFRDGPIPFDEIRRSEGGRLFDIQQQVVAGSPGGSARFQLAPADVVDEIAELHRPPPQPPTDAQGRLFDLMLISRRLREVFNSAGRHSPQVRARQPYNAAYMHPDDLVARQLVSGDHVRITSDNGSIAGIVAADPSLRRGVVSMAHGWGGLPDEEDYQTNGSSVGLLISTERDCEKINAMPRQSAIPVHVRAMDETTAAREAVR